MDFNSVQGKLLLLPVQAAVSAAPLPNAMVPTA